VVVDVADGDAIGPSYRYRRQPRIQSSLVSSDKSESSDSDSDSYFSATHSTSR